MRYKWALGLAMLGVAAPAFADAWDFILTNNTGKEIKTIEVSPAGANQWQPNKVDDGEKAKPIKPAGRTTIHFDKSATQCKWEVKATFADDTTAVFPAVNLCDASFVTIRYANGTPAATGS
ncbi:hypothetical protein [Sphingomonas sp.]|jgi:hypothetical protein|uniref:hypothetical protein n=1 Tax=Sphingomonas sp. TaxID=28214 RepID=UPI002E34D1F5|nr:hypothetical protein [Sphingomonas sp.]HEX4695604.1 hypothetical protein [Sphingomonas sp.]